MSTPSLTPRDKAILLQLAKESIRYGLQAGKPLMLDISSLPESLQQTRASFVTLHKHGQLRGCIGSIIPTRPLALDVSHNAFAAAFQDPRFPPVQADELDDLDVEISILSMPEPIEFTSEEDLLEKIRPGIDGLILKEGPYSGTFLPSVWEQIPDKREFLRQLKRKAGLPADYWSPTIRVFRYTTDSFSEKDLAGLA
jgi:AmmeMemoRadiSam system protein A